MRALRILRPNQAEVVEVPTPSPGPGEILIRIEAVNTCPQWDLHIMSGSPMFPGDQIEYPYPAGQPGHEAAGEVLTAGAGVETLRPGDRVALWRDPGPDVTGCYAECVVRDPADVLLVPDHLEYRQVASIELAACVQVSFDQLERADALKGARFGVSGLGPAGLIALQMARAYGAAEVVAFDPIPERRKLALRLGADSAHPPADFGQEDHLRHGRLALDASVECAGAAASAQFLADRTRHALALLGVLRDDFAFGFRHWDGLSVFGYGGPNAKAAARALVLVAQGRLDLLPLITHTLPLERYPDGVKLLAAREAIKICFEPSRRR